MILLSPDTGGWPLARCWWRGSQAAGARGRGGREHETSGAAPAVQEQRPVAVGERPPPSAVPCRAWLLAGPLLSESPRRRNLETRPARLPGRRGRHRLLLYLRWIPRQRRAVQGRRGWAVAVQCRRARDRSLPISLRAACTLWRSRRRPARRMPHNQFP